MGDRGRNHPLQHLPIGTTVASPRRRAGLLGGLLPALESAGRGRLTAIILGAARPLLIWPSEWVIW